MLRKLSGEQNKSRTSLAKELIAITITASGHDKLTLPNCVLAVGVA